jgi:hypothetical protein
MASEGPSVEEHAHHGHFSFDLGAILAAAGSAPAASKGPLFPEQQYVDLDAVCARATLDWDFLGIGGTLDFYQPAHGELLVDASFDNAERDSRYGVAIHTAGGPINSGSGTWDDTVDNLAPADSASCDPATNGPQYQNGRIGTLLTDRKGRGSIHTFLSGVDLEDVIGMTVVLMNYDRLSYPTWLYSDIICHKGTIEAVACPTVAENAHY